MAKLSKICRGKSFLKYFDLSDASFMHLLRGMGWDGMDGWDLTRTYFDPVPELDSSGPFGKV